MQWYGSTSGYPCGHSARLRGDRKIVLKLSKYLYWILSSSSLSTGNILEYWARFGPKSQILSTSFWRGLHFWAFLRVKMCFWCRRRSLGRAARDFFKNFGILVPDSSKFCSPAGASLWGLERIGSWLSKYWQYIGRLIASLSIGQIYGHLSAKP